MKPRHDNSKRFPKKSADGKNQCQECGKPTEPGKLPKWWHPDCLEAYLVRSDPAHARKATIARDKGVCAICTVDTERLKQWLLSLPHHYTELLILKPPIFGRRDRFTYSVMHGAQLGRHRARALVLLGRLWGMKLS